MYNLILITATLAIGCGLTSAFNVDVGNYIRHEGQADSMFGFSVTLHQEAQRSWVIIGAPTADTSNYQEGVRRGGAVYRCDISDDNRCQIIPFDSNGNQFNERNEQVDTKSYQWFGATVASAGIDGPLVACAPRYVFHTLNPRKVERVEPVGTCYIAKNNFQSYSEYSPCRTMYWGYHRQGSCQAGMSAAVTKSGDRVFIGAPGSWYWQGQAYSINTEAVFPYKPPRYGQFGEGGQIYSFSLSNPKDRVYSTGESTAIEDDSYLGYSSVTGDFLGTGEQGAAIGMPRGGGLLGKVLVFTWNMTNWHNITGEQIGAYFGYSICSIDVDGDSLDDLIIGAPMYTEPNNEGKYETGRVYIMYQGKFNKFTELDTRDGLVSKGRFGLSLASLKDINLDGFGDFAVGAPYDGPNGRGAVYIYHGSPTGPLAKHSQVIYAEDVVGTPSLNTFGFSLGGGIDLDGNMYPDMVVGAYNSNKAIVFKSRPVAVMEATTTFESETKLVSLDEKNCTLTRDRKQVTCTSINSCMKYRGQNLPATIDIEVSWVLDAKKPRSPRMFFLNDEGRNIRNSTMRLYRGKLECRNERVYITENIRDKLTPLEVEMRYNFRSTNQAAVVSDSTSSRRRRAVLEPVLDQNRGTVQRDSINIQKNCGPDNVCIPDLRLEVKTVDKYLLGSKDLLVLEVLISNFGEDAFEANYHMNLPHGLNFKKIERIGDIRDTPITCTAPSAATNNTLKCDIGNPLSAGKVANFKVVMNPSDKSGITPAYDFFMEVNSTNAEQEGAHFDNVIKKSIQIWVETDLAITGKSFPPEILYNISQYNSINNVTFEHQLGPQVVHIYNIRNNGPSTIEEAEVFVMWPLETNEGDPLMYLLNQPETSGNIRCDPTIHVNERDYFIDSALERKSFLEMAGVAVTNNYYSRAGYHGSNYQGSGVHVEKSGSGSSSSSSSSGGSYQHSSSSGSGQRGGSASSGGTHSGSGGGYSGSRTYTSGGVLTQDDKKYLDAEEDEESTGDASFVHRQRAGAVQSGSGGRAGGNYYERTGGSYSGGERGGSQSSSSSWNSSSSNQGPTYTYSASRNRSGVLGADGVWRYTEASTENYGNVLAAGFGGDRRTSSGSGSSSSSSSSGGGSAYQSQGASRSSGQNQNVNYGDSYSRTSGGSANVARTGGAYRGNEGSRSTTGVYRVEDIPTEEIVSQDISGLSSRTQHQASHGGSASRTSSSSSGGGRFQQNSSQGFENAGESGGRWSGSSGSSGSQSFNTGGAGKESWSVGGAAAHRSGSASSSSTAGAGSESGRWAGQGSASEAESGSISTRRRMKSQQDGEPSRPDLETGVSHLEKLAQGQSGFQTTSFELPQVQRNNVDDDLRHRSEQTWAANSAGGGSASRQSGGAVRHSTSGGGSWQSSNGHETAGRTGGGGGGGGGASSHSSHSSTSGTAGGGHVAGGQSGGSQTHHTSWSSGGGGGAHHSSSSHTNQQGNYDDDDDYSFDEYDNIEDEYSSHNVEDSNKKHDKASGDKLKHYQRFRRQAFYDDDSDVELKKALRCTASRCAILRCVAGPLLNQNEAWIAMRTRLVADTMHKTASNVPLTTSTMAVARINKLPYIGTPKERPIRTHELQVKATPEPVAAPDVVPLWVVVLAACAGTIILLLLIYLLYKCGFFKRNRPTSASSERQPLNRNNGYHGDEHL